jgi:ABC-2 type transport system ATP-binding protein
VSVAKALLNRPEVLLLDEPTASLDPDIADRIRTYLIEYQRQSGATLLLASHNMVEVERICHQVLMMKAGRIVNRGSPPELIARYGRSSMEEVFLDVARSGHRPAEVAADEVHRCRIAAAQRRGATPRYLWRRSWLDERLKRIYGMVLRHVYPWCRSWVHE